MLESAAYPAARSASPRATASSSASASTGGSNGSPYSLLKTFPEPPGNPSSCTFQNAGWSPSILKNTP